MLTAIAALVDVLEGAHVGPTWSGPSLREALVGCTVEEATRRPIPGAHTVWEVVLHTAGWAETVRRRLGGEALLEPADGDWPAPPALPSDAAWADALAHLDATHAALVADVRALDPYMLGHVVMPEETAPEVGGGVTVYRMLHGVAGHALYHAGQIVLLRRALGA